MYTPICRACVRHTTSIPLYTYTICFPTSPNVLCWLYNRYSFPHIYVSLYIMIIDDVHSHDLVKLMVHVVNNSHVMITNPLSASSSVVIVYCD